MSFIDIRIEIIRECLADRITVREASERLGLHRVTFWRLVKRYERFGRRGLEHGLKGRPSNRALPESFKKEVRAAFERDYAPSGRSVLSFYLERKESLLRKVSYTAVLSWIGNNGISERE